ncbi:MAG: PTS fructose transporter subunit IIB [Vibrionaceae bacterium]
MRIIAVTACPTGIAHTYMAAELLRKTAQKFKVSIKIETQGAMGIENMLTPHDIAQADKVFIVSDIAIEHATRFTDCNVITLSMEDVLFHPDKIFLQHCRKQLQSKS